MASSGEHSAQHAALLEALAECGSQGLWITLLNNSFLSPSYSLDSLGISRHMVMSPANIAGFASSFS